MARKSLFYLFAAVLLFGLVSASFAQEKVKWSSSVKMNSNYYLPPLTAEERGFWKENGLEGEWIPFAAGPAQMQAAAAGHINIGLAPSVLVLPTTERGVPLVMVAEFFPTDPFIIWVRRESPYRQILDLKGKRIAVTALASATHAYGRLITKAHGMEKDVRFVGAGTVPTTIAGLKVGAFEAMIAPLPSLVDLKAEGIIREIASADDYVPKPWLEHVIFARKDYVQSKAEVVRRTIKAMLQVTDFLRKNPRWAMDKMKNFQGLSEEAARLMYNNLYFTTTGRVDRKAVENVRRILIEYGLNTEKAPAVDDLFTNEYIP